MAVCFGLDRVRVPWEQCTVCIGTFDGVHKGHQRVISGAVSYAGERQMPCTVVTFDRNPLSVLNPERCPPAIGTLGQNLAQIAALGPALIVVLPFTAELAAQEAGDFFQQVIVGTLRASAVQTGHDFAFGRGRVGTPEWLRGRIETHVEPPLQDEGIRISSSAIRTAIAEGQMELASRWMGRSFALEGVVVAGFQKGRELGFPTANLALIDGQALPADGVYAGEASTPYGRWRAAISVGTRPTFMGTQRAVEAHLLDFDGRSLYGCPMELGFSRWLRGQEAFSVEDLKRQMAADLARVRSGR